MNKSRPRHTPVQSFGPHIMAALMKGAIDGFTVAMPYHRAVRFRQRIYMLRKAMREEKHEQYSLVSRVRISISWPKTAAVIVSQRGVSRPRNRLESCLVEVVPSDSEYADDLRAAGVDPLKSLSAEQLSPSGVMTIDDLLGELKD